MLVKEALGPSFSRAIAKWIIAYSGQAYLRPNLKFNVGLAISPAYEAAISLQVGAAPCRQAQPTCRLCWPVGIHQR